jgi:hypothetical protein
MASVSISGLVLTPVSVLAGVLGVWRLGEDLGWTSHFFKADGLLSRYQLWFAVAISARTSAFILNRWVANQKSYVGAWPWSCAITSAGEARQALS